LHEAGDMLQASGQEQVLLPIKYSRITDT